MSTFTQFMAHADKGEIRRCTWLCGDQPVLIEQVIDTIRDMVKPSELDYISFTAGTDTDATIWAAANQYPLTPGAPRLILVRNAGKIRRWDPLADWMDAARILPGVHLVLVSADADFPYTIVDGKKAGLKPPVDLIQAKRRSGMIVRCAMPNASDAVAWVRRRAPALSHGLAGYLLTRTGGDLAAAAGVCDKIALFDATVNRTTVDALCQENPADSFVDCLLYLRKPQALLVAAAMDPRDYGKVIGQLDARLDLLATLCRANSAGLGAHEIHGVSPFLVRQYLPCAKYYTPTTCVNRRRLLAVVDEAYRSGAREAIMESLVALW